MGTFNKWGHYWRKKFQWAEVFNQNCTGTMKGIFFVSFLFINLFILKAQLSVDQTLATCYGQSAFKLAKFRGLYQNTLIGDNHLQVGITPSASIGVGIMPYYNKQIGVQIFNSFNISQVLYKTKGRGCKNWCFWCNWIYS